MLSLLCFICLCSCSSNESKTATSRKGEAEKIAYTYHAEAMQNVDTCIYISEDLLNHPEKDKTHISVSYFCPSCGRNIHGGYMIFPEDLDFSNGDTIQFSDSDTCSNCHLSFMWVISITRQKIEK